MLFKYKAINKQAQEIEGTIEALNKDLAISSLQRRELIVLSITSEREKSFLKTSLFKRISSKDIVILSRQIAILFGSQISALKAFNLLTTITKNDLLAKKLEEITTDIQGGSLISEALAKHNDVFSDFYISMVKAGEEAGKLNQVFNYLADYLERQYKMINKVRNALVYPIFIVFVFIAVVVLLLVFVIPKLSMIITESGQEIPFYTKIVLGLSNFFTNYGIFLLILLVILGIYFWRLSHTKKGKRYLDEMKLTLPFFGSLYQRFYLARIADNLETMLTAGIPIIRAIEVSSEVVGNEIYQEILKNSEEAIKSGSSFSASLMNSKEIPEIVSSMIQIGEETATLPGILKTLADFYTTEVNETIDTLISLIEPALILGLGVVVGGLLASVLIPIYNIAGGIS